jgi:hypothetical protein
MVALAITKLAFEGPIVLKDSCILALMWFNSGIEKYGCTRVFNLLSFASNIEIIFFHL